MAVERVGIVGCGLMGSGIAEVAARAGLEVLVVEVDEDAVSAGRARIERSVRRAVESGKVTETEGASALSRISFATALETLAGSGIVIEAIVEDLEAKKGLFRRLDEICGPATIFASNTSSLSITEIAAASGREDRLVGLHFFNPVPVMKLVEVVKTLATSDEVYAEVMALARRLGKEPITTRDNPGFVVNLLLVPYLLDAIRHLERGVASVADIDRAMVLGTGHPMGPFALADFVGLDTLHRIARILHEEYAEARYAPPPLLRRMVALGRLGRKVGRGFYDWSEDEPVPIDGF